MKRIIAAFDLEGTLIKRSKSFMREMHNIQKRGITDRAKMVLFDISIMMIFFCYKTHLIGELTMRTITIKRMATLLKGSTEREIAQRARIFATQYMELLQPETSRILQEHIMKGHTTVLFSGMLQPFVEAVKQELGINIAIGTELEIEDGNYTGGLSRIPYFGERRAKVLSGYINKLDYKVNLSESFAYGDAIFDRYFMGMVGNPVAVYPDKKLAEYAQKHGWDVIT